MAKNPPFSPPLLLPIIIIASFLLFSSAGEAEEKETLQSIRNYFGNSSCFSSWNDAARHCEWWGIRCFGGAVAGISLSECGLAKPVPADICNLKNLSFLDLSFNNIPGRFPVVLYNCTALENLDISQNRLVGEIPADVDKMAAGLARLVLSANNFSGDIPPSISRLPAIKWLHLDNNLFNGRIPPEMANLSSLESLWLADNPFPPARISPEIGNLTRLAFLWMANMNLVGVVPETLGKLANLGHLDLAMNSLTGRIPAGIWMIKPLKKLYLYKNKLTGEINELISADGLMEIDLSTNQLSGAIPKAIGQLRNLSILFLYFNQLSGHIPASVGRLTKLTDIRLFNNRFTGVIPPELGLYSKLSNLEIDDNGISGQLPDHLCDNKALVSLIVFDNQLTGKLPESLGSCYTLKNLQIHNNGFSGELPTGIWSAKNLTVMIARNNSLTGALPDKLPWNLTLLDIRKNQFFGKVPPLGRNLRVFYGDDNSFSDHLPANFSEISLLQVLSLGNNEISGEIPAEIGRLSFLNQLNLRDNLLSGQIPETLGSLTVLNALDLSENDLSGEIPPNLGGLKLNYLNLSSNDLTGEVPIQLQNQAYEQSFLFNPKLCFSSNSINNIHNCRNRSKISKKLSTKLLIVFLTIGSLFLAVVVLSAVAYKEHLQWKKNIGDADLSDFKVTSFHKVNFRESAILSGLTPANLIGSGGSGMVYRLKLRRETVAVKKIWNSHRLKAKLEKEFQAEAEILGSIRHANIVKLLSCISGSDSKLLVYEYLENGSLDRWLHRRRRGSSRTLDWPTRLRIAVGAARGLCYMHHDCFPPIIHRDVKSSNILLDLQFKAKIADFGLARILERSGEPETVSTIAGSFGYMAPEYTAVRKVNEKVDVYSFGVVLLELATGREAADGGEEEDGSLADWAWRRYKERGGSVGEALDMEVVQESPEFMDEAGMVFTLGLICTGREPQSRPTMKEVLQLLTTLVRVGRNEDCGYKDKCAAAASAACGGEASGERLGKRMRNRVAQG
ncbi:hypothetical protein HPP92_003273 [Vanilla planifolia]|uniref:non-specific serine/threonine protein kinase n=1 Tax=Vanilla planifolia TaxID=51239 RepID=A0A835VNH2_VANPL|nr:hypothetical protein HPP92_003273 [Vanilla planifolia]